MPRTLRAGGSPSLLSGLLYHGVRGVLEGPLASTEYVVDPVELPAWQRLRLLAGLPRTSRPDSTPAPAVVAAPRHADGLLHHSARYVLLAPLAFRTIAVGLSLVTVLTSDGSGRLPVLDVVGVTLVAANLLWIVRALRTPDVVHGPLTRWLLGDLALAVLANLVVSATSPGLLHGDATQVSWVYLVGTVALWTTAWGGTAGATLVVLGVPLQALMGILNQHRTEVGQHAPMTGSALAAVLWLAITLVTTLLALATLGLSIRLAMAAGVRAGREAERAQMLRKMHDTVLQSLEAMALDSDRDRLEPGRALVEVRGQARSQARQIRRILAQLAGGITPRGLADELADVVSAVAALGVRAELVVADVGGAQPSPAAITAVRDAVHEGLRNTHKHSGVAEAVVRVDLAEDGLETVVRDHGHGFDADAEPGFGLRQSVMARLAEVGGHATVQSRPGHGTRLRLWVPLLSDPGPVTGAAPRRRTAAGSGAGRRPGRGRPGG